MREWDFARSVSSMRILTELGVAHGLSISNCLAGTGLKQGDLANPTLTVPATHELRLIRNLVDHLGHVPGLGIEAGRRYHFTAFGALGFAMVSCPTMRRVLELTLRYFHLTFAFTRFQVQERGNETHVILDDSGVPEALRQFVVERDSAAIVTVQRDLFSAGPGLFELHFSHPEPTYSSLYESFYGLRPTFNAADNRAIASTSTLAEPLPQANELALKAAEDQCRILLNKHTSRVGLAANVRARLARSGAQMPGMNALARELRMTQRTLRRRLVDEGTTFLKLRDEVRLALAEELLTEFALSVELVSERLGYSDPTCFINAFKRWTGKTPLAFRKYNSGSAMNYCRRR